MALVFGSRLRITNLHLNTMTLIANQALATTTLQCGCLRLVHFREGKLAQYRNSCTDKTFLRHAKILVDTSLLQPVRPCTYPPPPHPKSLSNKSHTMSPTTMKALVSDNTLLSRVANLTLGKNLRNTRASWQDVPLPTLAPNDLLIKVHAVALNPTDVKHIDAISPPGSRSGCDFAGEVVELGSNLARKWEVGDRVAGCVHGGLYPDRGAFAEYLKAESDLVWKIPEDMDGAEATTYGVSGITPMLALNVRLGLPWLEASSGPHAPGSGPTILVYAGSTSAGLFTIQLAKAIGCTVVTTASPHSFELVKRYGADVVFDYHDENVGKEIARQHPDIKHAIDCISNGASTSACDDALSPNGGGKVITLLPGAKPKAANVEHELIMAYTLYGKAFQWLPPVGPKFPAMPEDRAALVRYYAGLEGLTGTLRALPVEVLEGGREAVLPGLERLREGKVSGKKLVVKF